MSVSKKRNAGRDSGSEQKEKLNARGSELRPEKRGMVAVSSDRKMQNHFREKALSPEAERVASQRKRGELAEKIVMKKVPDGSMGRRDDTANMLYREVPDYAHEMKAREPGIAAREIKQTPGVYYPGENKGFVRDSGDTLTIAIHEKLHQKSNCDLPDRFQEGITQYLARKEAGPMGDLKQIDAHGKEIPRPKVYEKETALVQKLSAVVGDKPIEKAYFERRTDILKAHFESAMGEGSFERLLKSFE